MLRASRMFAMWMAIFSSNLRPARTKRWASLPVAEKDFRKILEQKDVDAITIATPDHWHTPMAIAGLQAGKHVYVEKPCSHNPAEGELLVQAQQKYRQAGADGHAATFLASHDRDYRENS